MAAACNGALCRQGRSPCPTPSACVQLVQAHASRRIAAAGSPPNSQAPDWVCLHRGGLFGLNDPDPHQEPAAGMPPLWWAYPVAIAIAAVASALWPMGFAA